jgi:hypothetical protein
MALATLSVDFVARLAEFKRGLDEAGRLADARSRQIASSFAALKTLGAGVAAGFTAAFGAGGAVLAFAQRINAPLLAMKDLSEATGATIENVSALENVARTAGTSLDVAGGALVRLNQQLGQTNGNDRTSEALRRIGLDAQELKRQDPAVALRNVAQALAQFSDDGEKARLVQELFGRSVREVGPFLKELASQQQFAATVTAKQVAEADKLNKEIAALKKNAEDAARAIASRLVPALNTLFSSYRASGGISGLFSQALEDGGAKARAQRLQQVVKEIESLQQNIERLEAGGGGRNTRQIDAFRETLRARREEADRLLRDQALYAEKLKGLANVIDPLEERLGGSGLPSVPAGEQGGARGAAAARPSAILSRPTLSSEQATLIEALKRLERTDDAKLRGLRAELEALVGLVQQGGQVEDSVFAGLAEEIAKLDPAGQAAAARLAQINALLADTPSARMREASDAAKLLFEELQTATDPQRVRELNQALEALWVRLGMLPEAAEEAGASISTFAEQASRNIQNALGDTLERVLQGNFSNIGRMWLQTLQRMAAQAAAAKLNQYLFGSGGAGGAGGGLLAGLASIFSPRADGGPAQAGDTLLVGERGPELITMGSISGYVHRAERLRGRGSMMGGGGGSYAPTININGDVGPATVALVERAVGRERARWQRMQYAGGMG